MAKPIDSFYGFRDFRFESPASQHPELVKLSTDSTRNIQIYYKPDDNLAAGQCTLSSINYLYYKGKLESVMLYVADSGNRFYLLEGFRVKYGKPTVTPEEYEDQVFIWNGARAAAYFGAPDEDGKSSIMIMSKIMQAKEKADTAAGL